MAHQMNKFLNKIIKVIFHPGIILNKLYWIICKMKIKKIGINSKIGVGFSIIGAKNIEIGNNFSGGRNVQLHVWDIYNKPEASLPSLKIGNNVILADNSYISCANSVDIGDGVLFGVNVFVCDNQHGSNTSEELDIPPNNRLLKSDKSVKIGNNVWLGRNVCVMPGVKIGDGVIVGANAVVTHDIPDYCVAVGVPARVIKKLK